jgi:hypothetical protein
MQIIKSTVIVMVLLTTIAATMFVNSRPAGALPACASDREFYSDDTFMDQVGDWNVTCQGIQHWGHSSCYYIHWENGPCHDEGLGECGGLEFTCSNGTITVANQPGYVGNSCGCSPVF